MSGKIQSLAICAMVVLGGLSGLFGGAAADSEPNNDFAEAELIGPGTHSGVLNISNNPNDIYDYYKFNVTAGQIISYNLSCGNLESGSVKFTMCRADRTQYQESDPLSPGTGQELAWITSASGAGQWFLRAEGPNNYSFDLELGNQTDAGEDGDAGDDLDTPRPVNLNETYTGLEGDDDQADFYSFKADAGQNLSINFVMFNGDAKGALSLYGPDKKKKGTTGMLAPDTPTVLDHAVESAGTYYLGLETGNNEYIFNVTLRGLNYTDVRKPVVNITYPADNSAVGVATIEVSGTSMDDFGVAKVDVSLSGIYWDTAEGTGIWTFRGLTLGEGGNTIYARATDTSGNFETTSVLVYYIPGLANDTKPPSIAVTSPANGSTLATGTFDLSGTASDDYGVALIEVSLSAIVWWTATGTLDWTYPGLAIGEGISYIWVRATDFAGNTNLTWISLAHVPGGANDTRAPRINITSPANWTILSSGRFDLAGTATDDFGVARVEVSLSAIAWWAASGTESWTYAGLAIGEGTSYIWARATDYAGNSAIAWIALALTPPGLNDTKKPLIAITAPANGSAVGNATFNLSGTASDENGIFKVEVSLSAINWWLATGSESWSFPGLAIGEGINTVYARATDIAGNTNITWITLAYVPGGLMDNQKPQVAVTSPANGSVLTSASFNLAGTASDNYAVSKVEVSLSGIIWSAASGTERWSYAGIIVGEGGSTVWVRATDFAGNYNITSLLVLYMPGGDTLKPVINFTSIKDKAKVSKGRLAALSGTASDNSGVKKVELRLNGGTVPVSFANGVWTASNLTLKEGKNTLAISATDFANNTESKTITVTYEKAKAQPGFEALLLACAVAAGLFLGGRRRRG